MIYWRNTNFTKRNYECTNVVFATTNEGGSPQGNGWEDCGEHMPDDLANLPHCQMLYAQSGVRYYGYL